VDRPTTTTKFPIPDPTRMPPFLPEHQPQRLLDSLPRQRRVVALEVPVPVVDARNNSQDPRLAGHWPNRVVLEFPAATDARKHQSSVDSSVAVSSCPRPHPWFVWDRDFLGGSFVDRPVVRVVDTSSPVEIAILPSFGECVANHYHHHYHHHYHIPNPCLHYCHW